MPPDLHGTFLITVTHVPEQQRSDLVLSGDVDMTAQPQSAGAVEQIGAASPRTVVVDLAGMTFGGATLVNFLARIHRAAPTGSLLLISCPTPILRTVLRITNMAEIATIRDDMYA
jgi:anti-anti-sigma regulatory factor